jgi:predicted ATPase
MLNKISINNFKCHENTKIELRPLTLLVGTNSSGKSSVIQALLLLIHNITNPKQSPLNGHLVSIGEFLDAKNFINNAKEFKINVESKKENLKLTFKSGDDSQDRTIIEKNENSLVIEEYLDYAKNNISYLSANRIGGQDLHDKNIDNQDRFGINGEYAIDYFEINKQRRLSKELLKDSTSETLDAQVNYWLNLIFNHSISTASIQGTDKHIMEYLLTINRHVRPKNIGSGVSYLISIIIICLSSKKDDLIIIENPEIHLHPKAQSILTDFFVFIANADRNLIIETHSDHIFNGVRVAINNKNIVTEKVSCNFFTLNKKSSLSEHTLIQINEKGRVVNYQDLLFDQFDNDINSLIGII